MSEQNNTYYYEILESFIKEIIINIKKTDFLTYFKKLSVIEYKDNILEIWVVSDFAKANISYKFIKELNKAAKEVTQNDKIKVILSIDKEIDNPSNIKVINCHDFFRNITTKTKAKPRKLHHKVNWVESRKILEKYRLDNFVVGSSNQLAFAACEAVSKNPGKSYNPLFIYWDVWLGKTHLLQATWNAIRKRHRDKKVVYITSDKFLSDYISSVKNRSTDKLREKYRSIDVLIIDDVQFLANKKQTQEELYNIFNIMYESNCQIIFSSDRNPKELTTLEPRLRSRFEWWITVDVSSPDFETRLAIIQEKAREREFIIPQNVTEFIAYNTHENIREIEWILNQIIAEYELRWLPPTLENISKRMKKLSMTDDVLWVRNNVKKVTWYEEVISIVSEYFGVDKSFVMGESRKKEYMIPRQVAMYLLKKKMNFTFERVWNIFNWRNHASVVYSCKKLETTIKKDQNLFNEVSTLRDKMWL